MQEVKDLPGREVDPRFGSLMRALQGAKSYRGLALLTRYSPTYVWELATSRKNPTPEAAARIDKALEAGGALIALVPEAEDGASGSVPPADEPHEDLSPLVRMPLLAVSDLVARLDSQRPGRPADATTIAGFAAIAAHYRRAYHAVAASQLLTAAMAHLDLVLSLHPAAQPDGGQRKTLLTTAGEMAALSGVLLGLDASRHGRALSHLDLAWSAARSAEDAELQAVVLGCRSFVLAYGGGDHKAGLDCADLGRDVALAGACAETRGWIAAVASERCASLTDLAGCQQRLDESRTALTSDEPDRAAWRGIGGFSLAKLDAYEGGDMVRLDRYEDAERVLDGALERLDPAQQRHRATALIDRAAARLGRDVDAACADASDALRLVALVQHVGNLSRIEVLSAAAAATGARSGRDLFREVQLVRADHGLPTRWETR